MSKQSGGDQTIETARRKFVKAQLDLLVAQEKRALEIARGERQVRDAQEQAARRTFRATQRVERRAGVLARAEARLHALTATDAGSHGEGNSCTEG